MTPSLKFAALAAEYTKLWNSITINPAAAAKVTQAATQMQNLKAGFYDPVVAATGVPWYVIGLIHNLECSFKTNQNLSNGDPLGKPTTSEPRGRPRRHRSIGSTAPWMRCKQRA
jgi:lysozyme family protein